MVPTHGQIRDSTRDSGPTIKCMAVECSHGKTEGSMMVSIMMTRSRDMEFSLGQMGENMKDTG